MYANSTALTLYKNDNNLYGSSLIEFISITCLCSFVLLSMTVSIIKNPHIRRMTTFMKYLYFFAAIANLTQLYSVKRHNKPNTSTNLNPKHWYLNNYYFTNSTYAMYSLLQWPWKNHTFAKCIDNIPKHSHIDHTTTHIAEQQKHTKSTTTNYNNFSCGTAYNFCSHGENSISAKHKNLKDELLNNNIHKITDKEYNTLYDECVELHKMRGHKIKAKNVGILNNKWQIPVGTVISINHLIALKLYTDYTKLQKQFKMYLRSVNYDINNCEIYYFFKYLQESCMLFGEKIKKQKLYTGIKQKLLFDSLTNTFHSPLSTTSEISVAQNFADDNGVVLLFKTVNKNERYFDLSWMSEYPHEREKLIMCCTLKISDMFIGGMSVKKYILAMNLMEQLCEGCIKNVKPKSEKVLYNLLALKFNERNCGECTYDDYIIGLFSNIVKKLKDNFHCDSGRWSDKLNKISDEKLKLLLSERGHVFRYMFSSKQL
eukprot:198278_1